VPVNEANDPSGRTGFDREIERLAILVDPTRRAVYRHVVEQGGYVSRESAAAALGIARGLAAFHLDRLVEEDLLEFTYRRPEGRTGPGAGRPAKLYRRSPQQVSISLPQRDYELLAELLASAIDPDPPEAVRARVAAVARRGGAALAEEARRLAGRRPGRSRLVEAGLGVLGQHGFDPQASGGDVAFRSCPFQAVARAHRTVVCPIAHALVEGFVEGLELDGVAVGCSASGPGCCVTLRLDS